MIRQQTAIVERQMSFAGVKSRSFDELNFIRTPTTLLSCSLLLNVGHEDWRIVNVRECGIVAHGIRGDL
jgi:hypothetical protein